MPTVAQALLRLEHELAHARKEGVLHLKIVHGYGSSGAGGEIRLAVQQRLEEYARRGHIRAYIFGENWSKSDELTWRLLQSQAELKSDRDLGRSNRGITVVVF